MSITKKTLSKYPNPNFVETGTCRGFTVKKALQIGFKKIYSIEYVKELYDSCCKKFQKHLNKRVFLYQGDTHFEFPRVLNNLKGKATFWLDAHYTKKSLPYAEEKCPILFELNHIQKHLRNDHTLLIDDVRLFGSEEFGYVTLDQVKDAVYKINSEYKISFENGQDFKKDILVCKV